MKKAFKLIISICFLCIIFSSAGALALEADPAIKVGLFYGTAALPAANLQNASGYGAGYNVGYFDNQRTFISLFHTDEIKLSILKDKPMWVNADNAYFDTMPATYNFSIGSYHLQTDAQYGDLSSATAAVATYQQMLDNAGVKYRVFPAYVNDCYRVRIGEYLTMDKLNENIARVIAAVNESLTAVGQNDTCYTVTITGTDKILFEYDFNGKPMAIHPINTNGKAKTWFKGYCYYGEFEYFRASKNNLTVINMVHMNDYIKGIIPYEVSAAWPLEAQKAQAICAKCYTVNTMNKHKALGFDLCNTTDCQVYRGTGQATPVSDKVVDDTMGVYALYNGKVAQTYYHSSSGGSTEDAKNIWGKDVPYLKAVKDTYLTHMAPYEFTVSLDYITEVLQNKGYTTQRVTDYYVSKYSDVGNVIEVAFKQADGVVRKLSGEKARTAINTSDESKRVRSHRYEIFNNAKISINDTTEIAALQSKYAIGGNGQTTQIALGNGDLRVLTGKGTESLNLASDTITIKGTGSGHNIGMSQWGAYDMANAGFTYDQIIKFYFTGVEVTAVQ